MAAQEIFITRLVGTVNQTFPIYVTASSVATDLGIANVIASQVAVSFLRSDMTAITNVAMTSAASLGVWSSGGWTQVNSNSSLGWYQLGVPNAAFSSGNWCKIHVAGVASLDRRPIPLVVELTKTDNQTYVSSQSHNIELCFKSVLVTSAAGIPSTDSRSILGTTYLTSVAGIQTVNVSTVIGSAVATSAAGRLTISGTVNITSVALVGVSTLSVPVGVSSFAGSAVVTSAAGRFGVDQLSILGSTPVTSAAGRYTVSGTVNTSSNPLLGVSTLSVPVGVSSIAVPVGVTTFAVPVGVSSFDIGVGVSSVSVPVGVSSVAGSAVVTSAAGVISATLAAAGSAALTEGYAALGATGTLPQLLYEIRSLLAEKNIVGTSMSTKKLDGITVAEVFTFNDSTAPTSVTRAS